MTDGTTRRKELMKLLQNEMRPLSGTELARHFGVSRQMARTGYCTVAGNRPEYFKYEQGLCVISSGAGGRTQQKNPCVSS